MPTGSPARSANAADRPDGLVGGPRARPRARRRRRRDHGAGLPCPPFRRRAKVRRERGHGRGPRGRDGDRRAARRRPSRSRAVRRGVRPLRRRIAMAVDRRPDRRDVGFRARDPGVGHAHRPRPRRARRRRRRGLGPGARRPLVGGAGGRHVRRRASLPGLVGRPAVRCPGERDVQLRMGRARPVAGAGRAGRGGPPGQGLRRLLAARPRRRGGARRRRRRRRGGALRHRRRAPTRRGGRRHAHRPPRGAEPRPRHGDQHQRGVARRVSSGFCSWIGPYRGRSSCKNADQASSSSPTTETKLTQAPGAPPRLWVRALRLPAATLAICRSPASPRSCVQHSNSIRRPDAPIG